MPLTKFKEIEHTADVGILAFGKTLEELFENAALGMIHISYTKPGTEFNQVLNVKIEEPDNIHLLVSWLSELNYLTLTNSFIVHSIKNLKITQSNNTWHLKSQIQGTKPENFQDYFDTEIKAVTYHKLKIEHKNGLFQCHVIFDI